MEDLLKLKDFADQSYYKTLAIDTEFEAKLEMVIDIVQVDADCNQVANFTHFEVSNDMGIVCRVADIQEAICEYNKIIINEQATV